MSKKVYILDDKSRKDLCCRIPRMLSENNLTSAQKLIVKYESNADSPILLSYQISLAEKNGDVAEIDRLFDIAKNVLQKASSLQSCEVIDFFVNLFSFYIGNNKFDKAIAIFEMGEGYDVEEAEYGMLWVSYYDKINETDKGIQALTDYLMKKKKLKPNEMEFLRKKYPNLSQSPKFNELFPPN